jgi:SAM-dependent methyltransferase
MRRTYGLLYRLGLRPWDSPDPPQPLVAFVAATEPGTAVDLGCGTGVQARYLVAHGWRVTAVDAVAQALVLARRADPNRTVTWRMADVTVPSDVDPDGRLAGACDLVLDNGCLHGLTGEERDGWASTVHHLAAPRAALLIRAASPGPRGLTIGPSGIDTSTMDATLGPLWSRQSTHPSGGRDWYAYARQPSA